MTTALEVAKETVRRSPVNYVRNGYSYCQTFAGNFWETFFGRLTPNSYSNATEAYQASKIASLDWNAAPPGAYHYFKYGKDGHVGVALGSGYMASGTGWTTGAVENLGKNVYVHRVSDYANHLPYLGWSYTNGNRAQITGLTDAYATPVAKNQRKVGSVELRRRTSKSITASYDPNRNLAAGTVVTPEFWGRGESVNGNDIWFSIGGLWSHSGGFTDAGIHDIPEEPKPGQRTVRSDIPNAKVRSGVSTSSAQTGTLDANATVQVVDNKYRIGQEVEQSNVKTNIWYKVPGGYAWAGSFTSRSVADLTLESDPEPEPEPKWPTQPYSFDAAGDFVDRVAPADWSNFENEWSVPDASQRKGFPDRPVKVVIHQWGNPGDYTIGSVINTFQARHENTGDRVSAHFVVDGNEIVQMVSLDDRAYHAGAGGNDYVGIEADPKMTPEVVANIRRVLEFLRDRNGGVALDNVLHKNIPGAATSCGTWIQPHLDELDVSKVDPEPEPDPGDDTPNWFVRFIQAVVEFLTGWLKK
jgi:hypothetical protein